MDHFSSTFRINDVETRGIWVCTMKEELIVARPIRVESGAVPPIEAAPVGQSPQAPPSAPVTSVERIGELDALRGLAVLSILLINIISFGTYAALRGNPHALGETKLSEFLTWLVSYFLFDAKFISIFCILFGAGIWLMSERRRQKGGHGIWLHCRRMCFLLLVGLIHGYFIWSGDILSEYAVCGTVAYMLKGLRKRWLVLIGFVFVAFSFSILATKMIGIDWQGEEGDAYRYYYWEPTQKWLDWEEATQLGNWWRVFEMRLYRYSSRQEWLFADGGCTRTVGLILLGMALMKDRVLSGDRSIRFYTLMFVTCFGLGGAALACDVWWKIAANWQAEAIIKYRLFVNYWASIPLALAWIAVVILACKREWFPRARSALSAVGRMAFTNYLMQSVICTFVFQGWGLGLFGALSRLELLIFVLLVWIVQLIWSLLWLRHFRFGPLEWVWRCFTYLRYQPLWRSAEPNDAYCAVNSNDVSCRLANQQEQDSDTNWRDHDE